MPEHAGRDPKEVATCLEQWFLERTGKQPQITDVEAPASNGFSNETILCHASWIDAPDETLVVRVAPTRHALFLDADFPAQYKVMSALKGSAVPLPPLGPYEDDPKFFGVPFFLMQRVDGLIPPDNLPYSMEGWVLEASTEEQSSMWWNGIEALSEIHKVNWRDRKLTWLPLQGLDGQLDYYRRFLTWAAEGEPLVIAEAALEWLDSHKPDKKNADVLIWGDARIGNMIWQSFSPIAVLDWEMATIGPPELDVGWWLYFDRQFTDGLGVPALQGFGSHDETVERYKKATGVTLHDLFYYEVLAGFRFSVIMARLSNLLIAADILPKDSDMATNNLATQFTAQLLDL